ncbi:unnamed protein product [Closterium sp. NIES-54]
MTQSAGNTVTFSLAKAEPVLAKQHVVAAPTRGAAEWFLAVPDSQGSSRRGIATVARRRRADRDDDDDYAAEDDDGDIDEPVCDDCDEFGDDLGDATGDASSSNSDFETNEMDQMFGEFSRTSSFAEPSTGRSTSSQGQQHFRRGASMSQPATPAAPRATPRAVPAAPFTPSAAAAAATTRRFLWSCEESEEDECAAEEAAVEARFPRLPPLPTPTGSGRGNAYGAGRGGAFNGNGSNEKAVLHRRSLSWSDLSSSESEDGNSEDTLKAPGGSRRGVGSCGASVESSGGRSGKSRAVLVSRASEAGHVGAGTTGAEWGRDGADGAGGNARRSGQRKRNLKNRAVAAAAAAAAGAASILKRSSSLRRQNSLKEPGVRGLRGCSHSERERAEVGRATVAVARIGTATEGARAPNPPGSRSFFFAGECPRNPNKQGSFVDASTPRTGQRGSCSRSNAQANSSAFGGSSRENGCTGGEDGERGNFGRSSGLRNLRRGASMPESAIRSLLSGWQTESFDSATSDTVAMGSVAVAATDRDISDLGLVEGTGFRAPGVTVTGAAAELLSREGMEKGPFEAPQKSHSGEGLGMGPMRKHRPLQRQLSRVLGSLREHITRTGGVEG